MTIRFTQSGGDYEGNELFTGSYYVLEQFVEHEWTPLPYIIDENIVGWEDIAYTIPFDASMELEENWAWLYGELPLGIYRIGKEIYDFGDAGICSKDIYYLEFAITD